MLRRRPPDALPWAAVVERLRDLDILTFPEEGVVAWVDGPSVETAAAALGDAPGWADIEWRRTFSDRALLLALLRFYGATSRHWRTTDEKGRARFMALLGADHPDRCPYPIVAAIAEAATALGLPAREEATSDAEQVDALSARLAEIGYERLWADAFLSFS